jgi:hypothetical protein
MRAHLQPVLKRQWARNRPGQLLNLDAPKGYAERIQWLKLHDAETDQRDWCDKLEAKQKLSRIGLPELVVPLAEEGEYPRVVKANHDSGRIYICCDAAQQKAAHAELSPRLGRVYGLEKGEWGYDAITPQAYAERLLADHTDYRFHMVEGTCRFIQINTGLPKSVRHERLYYPSGEPIDAKLSMSMLRGKLEPMPECVPLLLPIAERLAKAYRYVRVDLYHSGGSPYFGEITFWPMSGFCEPAHDAFFGELIAWGQA